MATVSEHPATDRIVEVAHTLGYKAKIDPEKQSFISEFFRGRQFRPHILVKNGDRKAIVMAASNNIGLGFVNRTHLVRENKGADAIICVPDWAFPEIRSGTRSYAKDLNVRLCPLSEVGDTLKELLG